MTNTTCDSIIRVRITRDPSITDKTFINCANSLHLERFGTELDSLDLGDAAGAFIRAAIEDFYEGDLFSVFPVNGGMIEVRIEFDLFNWH